MQTPVETRTLLPTLLDLAGLNVRDGFDTDSLAPVLRDSDDPVAAPVFSELTLGAEIRPSNERLVMIRDGPWKLSLSLDPEPSEMLLVNLDDDPGERINRIDDPASATVRERLLALAAAHVGDKPT